MKQALFMLYVDRIDEWMDGLLLLSGIGFRTVAVFQSYLINRLGGRTVSGWKTAWDGWKIGIGQGLPLYWIRSAVFI